MRLKIFSQRGSFWSWSLDVPKLETEVASWLGANPAVKVREIRHDVLSSALMPPQIIISIYFE